MLLERALLCIAIGKALQCANFSGRDGSSWGGRELNGRCLDPPQTLPMHHQGLLANAAQWAVPTLGRGVPKFLSIPTF